MTGQVWFLLTAGLAISMGTMVFAWLVARKINNAGIGDVAWSIGFSLVAIAYYFLGTGADGRRLLMTVMVIVWSLRLGIYLWVRAARRHPEEDARYAMLRGRFPNHAWFLFFGLFQLQAVLLTVLSVPFAIVVENPSPGMGVWEALGGGLWLFAVAGETIADFQLNRFRSNPENKGRVCATGLWKCSRHPNYFFEWLVWVAFFLFALGSPAGWITFYGPAIVLLFLFNGPGIAAIEEQALQSRGDAYREYRRRTSVFVPWFPRKSGRSGDASGPGADSISG